MGYYEHGNKKYYTVDDKELYIDGRRVRGMVSEDGEDKVSIKTYRLDSPGLKSLRSIGRFVGGAFTLVNLGLGFYGGCKLAEDMRDYLVNKQETVQTENTAITDRQEISDMVAVQK